MPTPSGSSDRELGDLFDRADAARTVGRGDIAAPLYEEVATLARTSGSLDKWTHAVLGSAAVYVFGSEPGKLPAQLYDVLARTTDQTTRVRLLVALARCWAYAGEPARGKSFADEALTLVNNLDAPDLTAGCLDAALAAHWGPDELDERSALVARLDDIAAHVLNPDTRLQAHMWRFQVACETLDVQAIHRQMRALELLGEESPKALFFFATRRFMLDLMLGRSETTADLKIIASEAAKRAGLADAWMVLRSMDGYAALQSGNTTVCAEVAGECEAFALANGIPTVCAQGAFLWASVGDDTRTRALLHTFHGSVLDSLPRDVNWLLILQCVLEAALFVSDAHIIESSRRLLTPYQGRAVFDAGAVIFHGVVDDTLARAAAFIGDREAATSLSISALATYERTGARWWYQRMQTRDFSPMPATTPHSTFKAHLHPTTRGLWIVGLGDNAMPLRAMRGFEYLRELLGKPDCEVAALDLVAKGSGTVVQGIAGNSLDAQALATYRQRLRDIDEELAEADEWADSGRSDCTLASNATR